MSERGKDVRSRIDEWIGSTGLSLEVATAACFRKHGFRVDHSTVYMDPQTRSGREIDVVASAGDRYGFVNATFSVECKSSPNPWVIVVSSERSPSSYGGAGSMGIVSASLNPEELHEVAQSMARERALELARVDGYMFRQAFTKADYDPAYAAAVSAVKASIAAFDGRYENTLKIQAAVPVVVVDAPLFECYAKSSGDFVLREVSLSSFRLTSFLPERRSVIVRVATRKGLEALARDCIQFTEAFSRGARSKVKKSVKDSISSDVDHLDLDPVWRPVDEEGDDWLEFSQELLAELELRKAVFVESGLVKFEADRSFYVPLQECATPEAIIDWVTELTDKHWASKEVIGRFLAIVRPKHA